MLLSKQAEQQVFGPDVAVEQPVRLLGGALENTFGGCREWYFDRVVRNRRLRHVPARPCTNLASDFFRRKAGPGQDPVRERFARARNPKEDVLGFDGEAAKQTGLVSGKEERATRRLRVEFKHTSRS